MLIGTLSHLFISWQSNKNATLLYAKVIAILPFLSSQFIVEGEEKDEKYNVQKLYSFISFLHELHTCVIEKYA